MSEQRDPNKNTTAQGPADAATGQPGAAPAERAPGEATKPPAEIGGRAGPDPTRYGDWEKGGRCIDF